MAGATPVREPPREELVADDEELVAGRRPVEEAFVARREAHRLLVVPQRRQALERIVLHATNLRIPIVEVEGGTLTALAGFDGHQGVALAVSPRRYATIDDVLARASQRAEPPFVLALDSLEDPQNVGTLLRSAEAAGVHGVLFPTRRQAPLTPAAVKASAGAVEHLLLVPVDDLAGALADLHVHGLRVAGAEAEAPLALRDADLRGPLAIVVGSEGQGLGPAVRRRCDFLLRIPMRGQIGSLNAAVAGSILLFEALGQRSTGGSVAEGSSWPTAADDFAASEAEAAAVESTPGETEASPVPAVESTPGETEASPVPAVESTPGETEASPAPPPATAGRPVRRTRTRTSARALAAEPSGEPDASATTPGDREPPSVGPAPRRRPRAARTLIPDGATTSNGPERTGVESGRVDPDPSEAEESSSEEPLLPD